MTKEEFFEKYKEGCPIHLAGMCPMFHICSIQDCPFFYWQYVEEKKDKHE